MCGSDRAYRISSGCCPLAADASEIDIAAANRTRCTMLIAVVLMPCSIAWPPPVGKAPLAAGLPALDSASRLSYRPRPMTRPPYAPILLLVAAFCRAAVAQISLAPEAGVLVLRNGQV